MFIGTTMPTNDNIIEEGLRKARIAIYNNLWECLKKTAYNLLSDAVDIYRSHNTNLTGNTFTSLAAGVYCIDRPYPEAVFAKDLFGLKDPVWHKLSKGDVFNGEDYNGKNRSFTGSIETDGDYGYNTSYHFLLTYKLPPDNVLGIVVCTGTESSEYLQHKRKVDVLLGCYKDSPYILEQHIRTLKM